MITQLKAAGLSDNEAKVYLAMLELGPAPVQEIAAKAGVNRPTAYVQIEALKKKHLASTQARGKKTFFIAETPENLESLLNKEGVELEARRAELLKAMPELAAPEGWKDEEVADALEVTKDQAFNLLKWYARLELGMKIQKCVTENGSCSFEAEF